MKSFSFIKITLITTVAAFLSLGAADISKAQMQQQPDPLTWGITGGMTISDMWGDDVGSTSTRAGFTGGLFLNYRTNPFFSVQPELLFSMKNIETSSGIIGQDVTTEYDFGYLEIPVLLKAHLPTGGMISPNLYAGPSLAFKLYGDANDTDLDDNLRGVDFGFAFGGGIDIGQRLNIDARYTLGVVDVFDVPTDPSAKNGSFAVTLGIGF